MVDWDKKDKRDTSASFFFRGMKTLWELVGLGGQKKKLAFVAGLVVLCTVLNLITPLLFKLMADEFVRLYYTTREVSDYFLWTAVIIILVEILGAFVERLVKEKKLIKSLIRLENLWPQISQEKLLSFSLGYHERENTGSKAAKIEKGLSRTLEMTMNLFWHLMPPVLLFLVNVVVVFFISWKIALLYFVPFIPAFWLSFRCFERYAPYWDQWNDMKEKSNGLFIQSLLCVSTVKSFVQELREMENFAAIRQEMDKLDYRIGSEMQWYLFGTIVIIKTCFAFTVIVSMYFALKGKIMFGAAAYILATGYAINQSVWQITFTYTNMTKHLFSIMRMKDMLDEEIDIKNLPNAITPTSYVGKLRLENVSFAYRGKEKSVLQKMSLDIPPSKMVALVSKTGEGKTTVIKLLRRMYDIDDGRITLDGKDIRNLDLFWYRRLFAAVQQDVDIFDNSIAYNVAYAHPRASEEEIVEALRAAHLCIVIENKDRFPDGINTQVGEQGVRLSGGEKQRVGIARAYLAIKNGSKILVLDEATSSLDSEAEKAIQEMIENLRKEMSISIIAIAHRLSTIKKADMIYVIGDGGILEKGDHNRLMSKNGLYSRLVELQNLGAISEG